MDRRAFLGTVTLNFAAPLAARAQQAAKVPRIGWLSIAARTPEVSHLLDAFLQRLRDLGYVEGQNIAIDYRFAEGKPERLPGFAAELLGLKVNIILAPNPAGIRAAKEATREVPIVMLNALDPVGSGLVTSLARPGGNITGLTATASPEMVGKYLELRREAVPQVSRVAVLRNPTNPDVAAMSREVERVARTLGVQLRVLDVRAPMARGSRAREPGKRTDSIGLPCVDGQGPGYPRRRCRHGDVSRRRVPSVWTRRRTPSY